MIRPFSVLIVLGFTALAHAAEPPRWGFPPGDDVPRFVQQAANTRSGIDWDVEFVRAPDVWPIATGKGVVVYVVDNGGDATHPAFTGKVLDTYNAITKSKTIDKGSHGTPVADCVLSIAPDARIVFVQVLAGNSGSVVDIAAGIEWAVADAERRGVPAVINLSLGGPSDSWVPPALRKALTAGIPVIAAAGNEGPADNTDGWPARYPEVTASVASCRKPASPGAPAFVSNFSSRGASVWITLPGEGVEKAIPGGLVGTVQGTSFAAPSAAGVAACVLQSNPQIAKSERPAFVREAFRKSGSRTVRTNASGFGVVDMRKIITATTPTPPTSITLTEVDLTDAGKAKLKTIGRTAFSLTLSSDKALSLASDGPQVEDGEAPKNMPSINPPGLNPPGYRWTKPGLHTEPGIWTLEPDPSFTPPTTRAELIPTTQQTRLPDWLDIPLPRLNICPSGNCPRVSPRR
jgi:subtilisin family serine protease